MFNKKEKATPKVEAPKLEYFAPEAIKRALQIIKEAVQLGQFRGSTYSISSEAVLCLIHPADVGDRWYYHGQPIHTLDESNIRSPEELREEQAKLKLARLESLKKSQAESVAEIEKLARELGVKA